MSDADPDEHVHGHLRDWTNARWITGRNRTTIRAFGSPARQIYTGPKQSDYMPMERRPGFRCDGASRLARTAPSSNNLDKCQCWGVGMPRWLSRILARSRHWEGGPGEPAQPARSSFKEARSPQNHSTTSELSGRASPQQGTYGGYQAARCRAAVRIFILPRSPRRNPPPRRQTPRLSRPAVARVHPWVMTRHASRPASMANLGVVDENRRSKWADEVVQKEVEVPVEEPPPPPSASARLRHQARKIRRGQSPLRSRVRGRPGLTQTGRPRVPTRPGRLPRLPKSRSRPSLAHRLGRMGAWQRRDAHLRRRGSVYPFLAVSYRAGKRRANQPYIAMMGRTEGLQRSMRAVRHCESVVVNAKRAVEILRDQVEGAEEIKKEPRRRRYSPSSRPIR